jgi:hypothetical protein
MARANLGDAAPWAALEVALGRGVHFQARQVAFNGPSDQRPASPGAASGLVGANALLRDNTKPAANYLLRPIWLRLVLDVDQWTAFTSWDGRTWTPAGSPVLCAFVGAWVGLCVTSHASGKFITATFDHLEGFSPAMVVQVGAA